MEATDEERIVDKEGLPLSFIIDLMKEISDFASIYAENFVYQIEKVLNEEYEEMNEKVDRPQSPPPQKPQVATLSNFRKSAASEFKL